MWLFSKNSFVSVVAHRDNPEQLLVRARRRADLARILPDHEAAIETLPHADYRYRLIVPRAEFAKVVADYVLNHLDYGNFKDAQEPTPDGAWHNLLMNIWQQGLRYQK